MIEEACDVAIVGAGPAGLAAAERLARAGARVVVLDREASPGGIPRHCDHPPFGLREFGRLMKGPSYAARLVERAAAAGADIRASHSVSALHPGGKLDLTTPAGLRRLNASAVLLATGVRETPRSARLIGGTRPAGVMTTGALQALVHLERRAPFRRPIILGTELVSFSAILTCRHGGIAPVAMIEPNARPTAWRTAPLLPCLLGIPVHFRTDLVAIHGEARVEGVTLSRGGETFDLACDGVIVSGRFRPEAALLRASHLAVDPHSGGPEIDGFGRCSDPAYFAAGNLLRPVETAGWSWREGRAAGDFIGRALEGRLPDRADALPLEIASDALKLVVPQLVDPRQADPGALVQLRVARPVSGVLSLRRDGVEVWRRRLRALPERRVTFPVSVLRGRMGSGAFTLHVEEVEG
jgi:NADPH-dependent 2,4-dienoyl-CoA reductase/sulfur reductase-like enzyme